METADQLYSFSENSFLHVRGLSICWLLSFGLFSISSDSHAQHHSRKQNHRASTLAAKKAQKEVAAKPPPAREPPPFEFLMPPEATDDPSAGMDEIDSQIGLTGPKKISKPSLPAPMDLPTEPPAFIGPEPVLRRSTPLAWKSARHRANATKIPSRDQAYFQLLRLRGKYFGKDKRIKFAYQRELDRLESVYERTVVSNTLNGNALRYAFEVLKDLRTLRMSRGIHNPDFFARVNLDLRHVYKMKGNRNIVAEIKRTLIQMKNYKVHFEKKNAPSTPTPIEPYYDIDCSQGLCVERKVGGN